MKLTIGLHFFSYNECEYWGLRLSFCQHFLLCSTEKRKSYGFEITWSCFESAHKCNLQGTYTVLPAGLCCKFGSYTEDVHRKELEIGLSWNPPVFAHLIAHTDMSFDSCLCLYFVCVKEELKNVNVSSGPPWTHYLQVFLEFVKFSFRFLLKSFSKISFNNLQSKCFPTFMHFACLSSFQSLFHALFLWKYFEFFEKVVFIHLH